jgi:hypothetical protein
VRLPEAPPTQPGTIPALPAGPQAVVSNERSEMEPAPTSRRPHYCSADAQATFGHGSRAQIQRSGAAPALLGDSTGSPRARNVTCASQNNPSEGCSVSPGESGAKRREKGLACSGNARVRRGMIQLAWRFLMFQKDSALAQWFRARTENARGTRKTMIVALARKLLIALWRLVREGVVPDGIVLRPGAMNGGRRRRRTVSSPVRPLVTGR